MRLRRALLLAGVAATIAAGLAYAQVPPIGSNANGWLQAIYNQLADASGIGPKTSITANNTGTTAAVTATLAAAAGKTTYICGIYVTGTTSTTANATAVTIANTITGSLVTNIAHPVTPALGTLGPPPFTPCIPANATNTAITVTSAADAAGSNIAVSAWGYQR